MLLHTEEIEDILIRLEPLMEHTFWIVGGSSALVLQGYLEAAGDVDIIQHSSNRVTLDHPVETRMWSRYYSELNIDLHYSNPFQMEDYAKVFHKIIPAIDYIDSCHNEKYKRWNIATPLGAGLTNWLHHFLEYGFNPERTICPDGKDKENLRNILTPATYDTIQWKVDMKRLEQPAVYLPFEEWSKSFFKKRRKEG